MREKLLKLKSVFTLPLVIAVLSFIILNMIIISSISKQLEISNESFRIHIVANSNSIEDQKLKYSIKEKVSNYIQSIKTENSKEEIEQTLVNNIDNIINISKQTVIDNGFDYDICANIGKINYETKLSNYYSMPAGTYEALEIVIGQRRRKKLLERYLW